MRADPLLKDGCYGVRAPDDDAEIERDVLGPDRGFSGAYRDDPTGQVPKDAPGSSGQGSRILLVQDSVGQSPAS